MNSSSSGVPAVCVPVNSLRRAWQAAQTSTCAAWPLAAKSIVSPKRGAAPFEGALAAEFALRDRSVQLDAVVRDNERALQLALVQLRVGSADARAVQQRQLALYSARTARLKVQTEQLAQRVNLHLALGGAFDDLPAVPVAAH